MAWEYTDFVLPLNGSISSGYYAKLGTRVTREGAREAWWAEIRPTVMRELRKWLDKGWESMTPIDSSCFIWEEEQKSAFLSFAKDTYLIPKEVRIQLRRPNN